MTKLRSSINIKTSRQLSLQLGLDEAFLVRVATNMVAYYKPFTDKDKKGKVRKFYSPTKELKLIQSNINKKILGRIQYPESIQGGINNRSIITNALMHSGKKYIGNFDIKSFFPSIDYHIVYQVFIDQQCSPDVARLLTELTTADAHVPQGFSTSPRISALVLFKIDQRLKKYLEKFKLTHSFWIDDLTISGNYPINQITNGVYRIFSGSGFKLNKEKEHISSGREKKRCTGLSVSYRLPNVSKKMRDKMKKILHICNKYGIDNYCLENMILVDKKSFINSLRGRVSFVCSVNKKNKYLQTELDQLLKKELH